MVESGLFKPNASCHRFGSGRLKVRISLATISFGMASRNKRERAIFRFDMLHAALAETFDPTKFHDDEPPAKQPRNDKAKNDDARGLSLLYY